LGGGGDVGNLHSFIFLNLQLSKNLNSGELRMILFGRYFGDKNHLKYQESHNNLDICHS
jgi:hypothetical protein